MRSLFLSFLVACTLAAPFTAPGQSGEVPTPPAPAKAKKAANASQSMPGESKPADSGPSKPEEPKRDYSQEAFVVEQ